MDRRHKVLPHGEKPIVFTWVQQTEWTADERKRVKQASRPEIASPGGDGNSHERHHPSGVVSPRTGTRRLAVRFWMACRLCPGAVFFFFLSGCASAVDTSTRTPTPCSAMHVSRLMRTGRQVLICFSVELVHTAHGTRHAGHEDKHDVKRAADSCRWRRCVKAGDHRAVPTPSRTRDRNLLSHGQMERIFCFLWT